jgi:hypothetical protein
MSRLIREKFNYDSDTFNLLEYKCSVLNFALPNNIYWWPVRELCIVGIGLDYECVRSTDQITVRRLITEYKWGSESNTHYVLGSGKGLIHNLLDTPLSELEGDFTVMLYDQSLIRDRDQGELSQLDLELQEEGGVKIPAQQE